MATFMTPHTLPSEEEIAIAQTSGRTLSACLQTHAETQEIRISTDGGTSLPVRVPVSALRLLVDALTEIGKGNAVSIVPIHAEMTTQEAADLLNVSRPYLVQLLEKGEIPFHKTGTHRRVRYQDMVDYKKRTDDARHAVLEELAAEAQKLGLGY